MAVGRGGRLPGAYRRWGLCRTLPPGALQPSFLALPGHRGGACGPGRRLPGLRTFSVRQAHPVEAPCLPPPSREAPRLDRPGGRSDGNVHRIGDPLLRLGERVIIGLFGTLFLVALVKGFVHVRAGRVAQHREWMIRAFAIALAVATIRLIYIPALLIMADPTDAQSALLWDTSFAVAFVVHASVAELWIRATRRSGAPRAGEVKAA